MVRSIRLASHLLIAGALGALGLGALATPASACAVAPRMAEHVAIAAESAIIVWDKATKTEHFIRRAEFQAEKADFGFLVPTPTKPELTEAPDDAFRELEQATRPEQIVERGYDFEATACALLFTTRKSAAVPAGIEEARPPVRVLEEKQVGGFDAAVLEADNPSALAEWLKSHGYASRPALEEWLAPYVEKKWKLTAYKIAAAAEPAPPTAEPYPRPLGGAFGTHAVRMTFHTERPFFPYREPRDQREGPTANLAPSRLLRLFVLGDARVGGTIGSGATPFGGRTVWAGPFDLPPGSRLTGLVPPKGAWLSKIEDSASPRPGVDDLWLDPSKDASTVKPPPIVIPSRRTIPIPLDLLAVVTLGGVLVVRRLRRK
jgi:hypothetical protein